MTSRLLTVPSFILLVLATPSPASAQLPGGALVSVDRFRVEFLQRMQIELAAGLRDWEQSWQADTRTPLRDHYSPDAIVLQSNGLFVRGTDEIDSFADAMRAQVSNAATSMADFDASEGIAYTYGPYAITPSNGDGTPDAGQLVTILLKENDRWRIRSQLFLAADSAALLNAPGGSTHLPPFSLPSRVDAETRTRYAHAMTLLSRFRSAWNEHSVERATLLLSEHPLILLPGAETPLRGSAAIAEMETRLPDLGALTTALLDFDARARISYLLGRYHMQAPGGGVIGTFMMVLADQDGTTKVRAVFFR